MPSCYTCGNKMNRVHAADCVCACLPVCTSRLVSEQRLLSLAELIKLVRKLDGDLFTAVRNQGGSADSTR